jgi:hypothetical protein
MSLLIARRSSMGSGSVLQELTPEQYAKLKGDLRCEGAAHDT